MAATLVTHRLNKSNWQLKGDEHGQKIHGFYGGTGNLGAAPSMGYGGMDRQDHAHVWGNDRGTFVNRIIQRRRMKMGYAIKNLRLVEMLERAYALGMQAQEGSVEIDLAECVTSEFSELLSLLNGESIHHDVESMDSELVELAKTLGA